MNTGLIIALVIIVIFVAYLAVSIAKYGKALKHVDKKEESEKLIHLNDKNFYSVISRGITIVDFWAAWCKPCAFLVPIINQVADNYGDKIHVAKLDVEANKKISNRLGIRNIPTVIIFNNGKEIARFIGVKPYNVYKKAIENILNPKA